MASGYSLGRAKSTMSSTMHPRNSSHDREDPVELNQMTRNVVDGFKRSIQEKINQSTKIDRSTVEREVSTVRRTIFRDQCKISAWKRDLPAEVENCPDDILILSIAYGDHPKEVKSIIQEKMNQSSTTNGSLSKVLGPLKKLKTELDRGQPVNVLRDVRNVDADEIERANRLFLSEALHFAPGVKGEYNYENAAMAVEGIRQSDCQSIDDQYLLAILKTARSAADVRETLEQQPKKSSKQSSTSGQSSRFAGNNRDSDEEQPKKPTRQTDSPAQTSRFAQNNRDSDEEQAKKTTKQTSSFGQSSRFAGNNRDSDEEQPKKTTKQANSPAQSSRFAEDNRSDTSSPRTSVAANTDYSYKPLPSPSFPPTTSKPTTRRFNDSSDDDTPSKPPPRRPERR